VPGFPEFSQGHDIFTNVAFGHFFSPRVLNETRFTFERTSTQAENPGVNLPIPSALGIGISPDLATGPTNLNFADHNLQIGFSPIGPQAFTDTTYSVQDTLTLIRGKHNWKFGGGVSAFHSNTFFAFNVNGTFTFFGGGGFTGNALSDFLLGLPLQYTQSPAAPSDIRSNFVFGFGQDEWRVRKNLTLSLGLRYEFSTPKSDSQGRTFSIVPGRQSTLFPNAPPGMIFPGDRGAPRGVNFSDGDNFAPRLGFAWDPRSDGKMSVRGAFGVYYDILKGEDNLQFNGKPPFAASAGFAFPALDPTSPGPSPYLSQPFQSVGQTDPFPSRSLPHDLDFNANGFLPIGSSGSVFVVDPHLRTPYVYQYHLTVERSFRNDLLAEFAYAGTSSHALTALQDVNPFILGTTNRLLNPAGSNNANCPGNYCYAWMPEFRNVGRASYSGLLASLRKQFSGAGIFGHSYFTLAYTYAHNIDNTSGFVNRNNQVPSYDPNLYRASADADLRHNLVFSGGWEIPFERAFASAPARLTNGWNLFPIISWRTGFPLDVFANLPSAFDFTSPGPSGAGDAGIVHANLVKPIRILDPRRNQGLWFDPTSMSNAQCGDALDPVPPCVPNASMFPSDSQALANSAVRSYGTLPRNAFRGPGAANFNLALSKTTAITEGFRAEVRADFFNLLNHAEFLSPDTNINDNTFGQILYTSPPRIIQLSLRLSF